MKQKKVVSMIGALVLIISAVAFITGCPQANSGKSNENNKVPEYIKGDIALKFKNDSTETCYVTIKGKTKWDVEKTGISAESLDGSFTSEFPLPASPKTELKAGEEKQIVIKDVVTSCNRNGVVGEFFLSFDSNIGENIFVSGNESSSVKSGSFSKPEVRKAEYTTGTFHIKVEGEIKYNNVPYVRKMLRNPFENLECIHCKVLPMCLGGCNFLEVKGKNKCIPEKYIIQDLIEL